MANTVYAIRDQVMLLRAQNKEVVKMLEDEIAARKQLEAYVKTNIKGDRSVFGEAAK